MRLDTIDEACIRVFAIAPALHRAGYQRLRVYPGMASSGAYWRLGYALASSFTGPIDGHPFYGGSHFSSGGYKAPFNWNDFRHLTADQAAERLLREYPELEAGRGQDEAYAAWTLELAVEVGRGRYPIFYSDYPDQGPPVAMLRGRRFRPPPQPEGGWATEPTIPSKPPYRRRRQRTIGQLSLDL